MQCQHLYPTNIMIIPGNDHPYWIDSK
jgi:hypothetical protein